MEDFTRFRYFGEVMSQSGNSEPVDGCHRSPTGKSFPISVRNSNFPSGVRTKMDPTLMTLCPMMRNFSGESKESGNVGSTPTDTQRAETPDDDKIDLRHISIALMKLLYPKVSRQQKDFSNNKKKCLPIYCARGLNGIL